MWEGKRRNNYLVIPLVVLVLVLITLISVTSGRELEGKDSNFSRPLRHLPPPRAQKTTPQYSKRSSISVTLAIYGDVSSHFYAPMQVGTPGMMLNYKIDLTTSKTAIPLSMCNTTTNQSTPAISCYAKHFYTPSNSSTSKFISCDSSCTFCTDPSESGDNFSYCGEIEYFDTFETNEREFMEGVYINDAIHVSSLSAPINFLGFYYQSPSFSDANYDGILGLGPSDTPYTSWFSTLVSQGKLENMFSLCLSEKGGVLILGGKDDSSFAVSHPYTVPLHTSSSIYYFLLTNMSVNGVVLNVKSDYYNPTSLDTSTQNILLSPTVYYELISVIQSIYCYPGSTIVGLCGDQNLFNGYCFEIEDLDILSYPKISFLVSSVNLTLDPQYYLYSSQGYYCNAIQMSNSISAGTVLGSRFLMKYYTVFDFTNAQLSFSVSSNCTGFEYILEYVSGNNQTGAVDRTLPNPFSVIVRRYNDSQVAAGVSVKWQLNEGGGQLQDCDSSTDNNGYATCYLKMGPELGQNIVIVSLSSSLNSPILFYSTGIKGLYFYLTNAIFMVSLLFGGLGFITYYDKRVLGNTRKPLPKAELRTLGIYKEETTREMNEMLLGWSDLHDHPVRVKNQPSTHEEL